MPVAYDPRHGKGVHQGRSLSLRSQGRADDLSRMPRPKDSGPRAGCDSSGGAATSSQPAMDFGAEL